MGKQLTSLESMYVSKIQHADLIVYGNISHVTTILGDPIKQKGYIFTLADLKILEVFRQSNSTPVYNGDTIPVFVIGGTIGNETFNWKEGEPVLREVNESNPAIICCLFYDKDRIDQKGRYHIYDRFYEPYDKVKQDMSDISSGKVTIPDLYKREREANGFKEISGRLVLFI